MLEPIARGTPQTGEEILAAMLSRDDSIARCEESGATLLKSDGQYVLKVPDGQGEHLFRRWSRRSVRSDEEALEKANKALSRILNERGDS